MPYFVYKIALPLNLTYVETMDRYRDARTLVRGLRQKQMGGDESQIRMVFAKDQGEAEKLLSRPRDERVLGED